MFLPPGEQAVVGQGAGIVVLGGRRARRAGGRVCQKRRVVGQGRREAGRRDGTAARGASSTACRVLLRRPAPGAPCFFSSGGASGPPLGTGLIRFCFTLLPTAPAIAAAGRAGGVGAQRGPWRTAGGRALTRAPAAAQWLHQAAPPCLQCSSFTRQPGTRGRTLHRPTHTK